MAKNENDYDPNNPAHKAIAQRIIAARANLSDTEKNELADAMNKGNLGKAAKILKNK